MTPELRLIIGEMADAIDQPRVWEPNENWQEHAACRGLNPDLFFPAKRGHPDEVKLAKAICLGGTDREPCPVLEDCRRRHFDEVFGIWFGTTPVERKRLRSAARAELGLPQGGPIRPLHPPAPCGTTAGYQRHHVRGEVACAACKEAKRLYSAVWKANQREQA